MNEQKITPEQAINILDQMCQATTGVSGRDHRMAWAALLVLDTFIKEHQTGKANGVAKNDNPGTPGT